ncbi:hypothetical protein [Rugosimonospora africana]|uniref:Uncharacterized protein n=1 Tax=Rugosimonospora africana TaxID=556532 RepID=A0A8J3QTW5_9ACTN|nr:hypothetical protein [Rugosimonospora africana]GIH15907.1 hypothetical protein Raf01_40790 [Rugosimonospora africana]
MAHQHDLAVSRESEEFLGKIVGGLFGEGEDESEAEGEEFLGGIGKLVGGLLGEGEDEFEDELEGEFEDEFESEYEDEFEGEFEDELEAEYEDESEEFLGGLGKVVGGLLGESEYESEYEDEAEFEDEYEAEYEDEGEEFFKGLRKRFGGLLRKAAPMLKTLAKTAGPLVATAVGGPIAGMAARALTSQLEGEAEGESESELEADHRAATGRPLTAAQCEAEALAAMATQAASEAEAEALAGAASLTVLSARDRRALARVLPGLVRGSAVITRLLYGTQEAREFVRAVPTIVRDTAETLTRRASSGAPVTSAHAGRVMARHTARVLGSHRRCRHALARNVVGARRYAKAHHGPHHGPHHGHRGGYQYAGGRPRHHGARAVRGYPVRNRLVGGHGTGLNTARRSSTMRVVTPVRVPGRPGQPARTVRVVTDVRVPRGATPARTATVTRVGQRHTR